MVCCEFENIRKWTKIIQLLACGGLVAIGIIRFINPFNVTSPIYYIINIYLIILGLAGVAAELGVEFILRHFNLLRFYFGKAFYCAFLGFFCYGIGSWYEIVVACVEWFAALCFIILGVCFFKDEKEFNAKQEAEVKGK